MGKKKKLKKAQDLTDIILKKKTGRKRKTKRDSKNKTERKEEMARLYRSVRKTKKVVQTATSSIVFLFFLFNKSVKRMHIYMNRHNSYQTVSTNEK